MMVFEDKKGVDDVYLKFGSSIVCEFLLCDGIEFNSFVEGKLGGL